MRRWLRVATVLPVLLLAACSQDAVVTPTPGAVDIGGAWTIARVGDVPAVPALEPRVEFLDGGRRIRVTAPECSEVVADLAIDGEAIRVGSLQPTNLLPCGGDAREFAGRAHDALARGTAVRSSPGRLLITGGGDDLLLVRGDIELTPAEQELVERLHAADWRYVDGDAPADPELPAIRLGPRMLVAEGPCGFTGNWQLRGEDLVHFGDLMPSEGDVCDDLSGSARAALFDVLEGVERAAWEPATRTLRLTGREGRLIFEAAAP